MEARTDYQDIDDSIFILRLLVAYAPDTLRQEATGILNYLFDSAHDASKFLTSQMIEIIRMSTPERDRCIIDGLMKASSKIDVIMQYLQGIKEFSEQDAAALKEKIVL